MGTGTVNVSLTCGCIRNTVKVLVLATVLVLGAWSARAQVVKINPRPLTPEEKKGYPGSTQLASGLGNTGIGQPLYLEALVTTGTVVKGIKWTLIGKPPGSTATLQPSPLGKTMPTYDGGDRKSFDVAGRILLVPDVANDYFRPPDYRVSVELTLPNRILSATTTFYGSKYIGINYYLCLLCHANKTNAFNQTAHATAFRRKINGSAGADFNSTCVSCHSVGYDTAVGPANGGFDDIALQVGWTFPANMGLPSVTNNWGAMPSALRDKANIQCENCHGPAERHKSGLGDTNAIGVSLSAGNCGQCHDNATDYSKNFEWGRTLHATGYVFRATDSCAPCHSTKGFIDAHDSDYVGAAMPRGTGNEGITCAACHDPHTTGMGAHQLRALSSATLGNGAVITRGGDGILCMNCHKSQWNGESYAVTTTSSGDFGPHHGPQADMLAGQNAVQYGMRMPTSRHLFVVTNTCVQCHMQETPSGPAQGKVGGHTFRLAWDGGTPGNAGDDVHMTDACTDCHGEIESFDFCGEDYDRDGAVEGVQSEIEGLLHTLGLLLPPVGSPAVSKDIQPFSHNLMQRKAVYNYLFVKEDGSRGVHNPKYAAALLQASLDDLSGGIDVDRDGLSDSWEIANFFDLTSQSGAGDADGDGVSNAREFAAGTNPKLRDTDGDGIWDVTEIQAGTDPKTSTSHPETNMVYIRPALELGYLPDTLGVTHQLQAVDVLDGKGWNDIGASFVSSNAWFYQLILMRDATSQFYRVIMNP